MQKNLVGIIVILLALSLPFSAFSKSEETAKAVPESSQPMDSGNGWKLVKTLEMGKSGKFIHIVLIDHDKYTDKTIYSAVIFKFCRDEQDFCRIRFWSQERYIPEKASLTTEQNKQLKAEYTVNKAAGIHQLRWSCSVDPDKSHCFSH